MAGDWRRLHNEELQNLYTAPNIIRVIKSRSMRRFGHIRISHLDEMRNSYKVLAEETEETTWKT
jgi:hypothetical protein